MGGKVNRVRTSERLFLRAWLVARRRRQFAIALLSLLIAAVGSAARPQDAPERTRVSKGLFGLGLGYGVVSKHSLLKRPEILAELKLTETQMARFRKAQEEYTRAEERRTRDRVQVRDQLRRERDIEGQAAFDQAVGDELFSLTSPAELPLMKVLDARQRTRLEQIQLRADGPNAFKRAEVHARLNLSPEQVQLILEIESKWRSAFFDLGTVPAEVGEIPPRLTAEQKKTVLGKKSVKEEIEKSRDAVRGARRDAMSLIAEILTKRQRAIYTKMIGEPFQFADPMADPQAAKDKKAKDKKAPAPGRPGAAEAAAKEKKADNDDL
jgi:hypothetical protein